MYKDNFLGKGIAPTSGHGAHYSKNAAPLDQPPLPRKNPRSAPDWTILGSGARGLGWIGLFKLNPHPAVDQLWTHHRHRLTGSGLRSGVSAASGLLGQGLG